MSADPLVFWYAIAEWVAWSKRHKTLRASARKTIETEGGEIERISIIGLLLKSPFAAINIRPIYLRIDCRYPDDSGSWYICGAGGGVLHWAWRSDSEASRPPAACLREVSVNNSALALPRWLSVVLYVLFVVGVVALPFVLLSYS